MVHAFIDFAAVDCGSPRLRTFFAAPKEILQTRSLAEVRPVMQAVHERSLAGKWCVGFVRYEAAPAWDSALQTHSGTQPLVWFGIHDSPLDLAPHDWVSAPPRKPLGNKACPTLSSRKRLAACKTPLPTAQFTKPTSLRNWAAHCKARLGRFFSNFNTASRRALLPSSTRAMNRCCRSRPNCFLIGTKAACCVAP